MRENTYVSGKGLMKEASFIVFINANSEESLLTLRSRCIRALVRGERLFYPWLIALAHLGPLYEHVISPFFQKRWSFWFYCSFCEHAMHLFVFIAVSARVKVMVGGQGRSRILRRSWWKSWNNYKNNWSRAWLRTNT